MSDFDTAAAIEASAVLQGKYAGEMTPPQIDTELSRIWAVESKAEVRLAGYEKILSEWGEHRYAGDKQRYISQVFELEAKIAACRDEATPYQNEYNRRPWRRFFLVTNQNGHIHTSMSCSTCFHDTQYAWLPSYSGMADEKIVGLEAYRCCTICMPIAPAEQKAARVAYTKAQRDAKAAERQAKADEKDRKGRERAVKLADKVEAAIETLGGRAAFENDYSLHGHDGCKSLYDASFDMQQTVADILYEIKDRAENGRSHYDMNKYVKAELTTRGLI